MEEKHLINEQTDEITQSSRTLNKVNIKEPNINPRFGKFVCQNTS